MDTLPLDATQALDDASHIDNATHADGYALPFDTAAMEHSGAAAVTQVPQSMAMGGTQTTAASGLLRLGSPGAAAAGSPAATQLAPHGHSHPASSQMSLSFDDSGPDDEDGEEGHVVTDGQVGSADDGGAFDAGGPSSPVLGEPAHYVDDDDGGSYDGDGAGMGQDDGDARHGAGAIGAAQAPAGRQQRATKAAVKAKPGANSKSKAKASAASRPSRRDSAVSSASASGRHKPTKSFRICLTNLESSERERLATMATKLGATLMDSIQAKDGREGEEEVTTVLVTPGLTTSLKCAWAVMFADSIVTPAWLKECAKAKAWLPTAGWLPPMADRLAKGPLAKWPLAIAGDQAKWHAKQAQARTLLKGLSLSLDLEPKQKANISSLVRDMGGKVSPGASTSVVHVTVEAQDDGGGSSAGRKQGKVTLSTDFLLYCCLCLAVPEQDRFVVQEPVPPTSGAGAAADTGNTKSKPKAKTERQGKTAAVPYRSTGAATGSSDGPLGAKKRTRQSSAAATAAPAKRKR